MKRKLIAATIAVVLNASVAIAGPSIRSIDFTSTPAPVTDEEIRTARTTSSAIVTYRNGKVKTFPLSYQVLYSSGDTIGSWSAGTIVDRNGHALQSAAVDDKGTTAKGPFHSRSPDANSLMRSRRPVDSLRGGADTLEHASGRGRV